MTDAIVDDAGSISSGVFERVRAQCLTYAAFPASLKALIYLSLTLTTPLDDVHLSSGLQRESSTL